MIEVGAVPVAQPADDALIERGCRSPCFACVPGKGGDVQTFAAQFLIRSTLVGCIVLLAYVLPDVETVVGVSGAIFMTMTIAILPLSFT